MVSVSLALYIFLILVRPMDWWTPVLNWQLVTAAAIGTFAVGARIILDRFPIVWQRIPELKVAIAFLVAAMLSWASKFYIRGTQLVFEDLGRVMFFFVVVLTLTRSMREYRFLIWTFLFCAAWMSLHAALQHHTGIGFGGQPVRWRWRRTADGGTWVTQAVAFGTFDDPNDLCLVLIVAIPLFYVQYKTLPNPIHKAIALLGAVLTAYGAWCTNSRGGVVGIFGMVAAYAIARAKGIRRYVMAAVAISIVLVLAPSRFGGGMVGRDRSILWGEGLWMFKENPLFGVGYSDFSSYSSDHLVTHNTYIHTLAEMGLVGYLPLFLLFYLTMVHLRRVIRLRQAISADDYLLLTGLFAALSGYLTGLYFLSRQYQHILYLILALAITATYLISRDHGLYEQVYKPLGKDIRNGLVIGLTSVLVFWTTTRIVNALS